MQNGEIIYCARYTYYILIYIADMIYYVCIEIKFKIHLKQILIFTKILSPHYRIVRRKQKDDN